MTLSAEDLISRWLYQLMNPSADDSNRRWLYLQMTLSTDDSIRPQMTLTADESNRRWLYPQMTLSADDSILRLVYQLMNVSIDDYLLMTLSADDSILRWLYPHRWLYLQITLSAESSVSWRLDRFLFAIPNLSSFPFWNPSFLFMFCLRIFIFEGLWPPGLYFSVMTILQPI